MSRRQKGAPNQPLRIPRPGNLSLADVLRCADQTARRRAVQRSAKGGKMPVARGGSRKKSVFAAIDSIPGYDEHDYDLGLLQRMFRWLLALLMLPISGLTALTFIQLLGNISTKSAFWLSSEFWYFATGLLLMSGWFFTRIGERYFIYLYVLGHELTHALFVLCSLGKVTGFKVGVDGGYITTNKSNIWIALSPYFFPFWSVIACGIFYTVSSLYPVPYFDKILYALMGASWGFHIFWTLWMIPRDQPDLKENDTFFSIAFICLANLAILSALLCFASRAITWRDFLYNWANNAQKFFEDTYQVLQASL